MFVKEMVIKYVLTN